MTEQLEQLERLAELAETHLQSQSDFYRTIDMIKNTMKNQRSIKRSAELQKALG